MKYLKFLLLAGLFLFFYGCEELAGPSVMPDEAAVDFRGKTEVVKPIKLWFDAIWDESLGKTPCAVPVGWPFGVPQAHAGGWVKGHGTHLGAFDWENSHWWTVECALDPAEKEFTNFIHMEPVGAHGDAVWIEVMTTIVMDDALQPIGIKGGGATIVGGTGRFEGATGSFPPAPPDVVLPITPGGESTIFMEGTIVLPK